jgi:hypothetical protein
VPSWRDDCRRTQGLDGGDDLGRVVALIGDDRLGMLTFQQEDRLGVFGGLSGHNAEGYRQPGFIGQ